MKRKLINAMEDMTGIKPPASTFETEVVVYAKIGNPEALATALRKEEHIQLETEFTNGTRCRVRKTTVNGVTEYMFTYKLKDRNDQNTQVIETSREVNTVVDEAFFEGFYKVAYREIKKTRYVFSSRSVTLTLKHAGDAEPEKVELPNVEFEVDVFDNQPVEGEIWCKIDIEVDNVMQFTKSKFPDLEEVKLHLGISKLPFAPQDLIESTTKETDSRDKISTLWKTFAKSLVDTTIPAK